MLASRLSLAFCLALALTSMSPSFSLGQAVEIDEDRSRILEYLDGIRSLAGRYEQFAPDGERNSGKFYIQRPNRVHFDEDAPDGSMIVSDGFWIAVIDKKSGSAPRYPLSSVPFASVLSEKPSEDESIEIHHVRRFGNRLQMLVSKRDKPELGLLTLLFEEDPFRLLGWLVRDAQQEETLVLLKIEEANGDFDRRLFMIERYERKN